MDEAPSISELFGMSGPTLLGEDIEKLRASHAALVAALGGLTTRSILYSMLVNGDARGYDGAKDAIDEREFDDGDVIALWDALKVARVALDAARNLEGTK